MAALTTHGRARDGSAQTWVSDVFDLHADRPAIEAGGRSLNYRTLGEEAAAIAGAVVAERGDVLEPAAILVRDGLALTRAYLAAIRAGRTVVHLDPGAPRERLDQMVSTLGSGVILASPGDADLARELGGPAWGVVDVDAALIEGRSLDGWLHRDPRSPYRITFTSGSTGRPKGIVRDHAALLADATNHPSWYRESDRVPLLFSGTRSGVGAEPMNTLMFGGTLLPFDIQGEGVSRLAAWLRAVRATALAAVPTLLRQLVTDLDPGAVFDDLRHIQTGGEALGWEDVRVLRAHLPAACEIWLGYGTSETGWITLQRVGEAVDAVGVVPSGLPVHGAGVELEDAAGQPCAPGEVGEVTVWGPHVLTRYLGADADAEARILEHPEHGRGFRTGDLGHLDTDGRLTLVGRPDGMVKIRGQRVELAEVELALLSRVEVSAAYVATGDSTSGATELRAMVAADPRRVTPDELRAHVRDQLGSAAVPANLLIAPSLPTLENGKLDRAALEHTLDRHVDAAATAAFMITGPRDDVEIAIRETVERLSGLSVPNGAVSLLDLGVDSIHLAALFASIESRFGVDLPLSSVIEAPTPAQLAALVHEAAPRWPTLVPVRSAGGLPPLFVVHGGRGNVVYAWPLAELLDPRQPVYALQHPSLDGSEPEERTLTELATRYVDEVIAARPKGPYRFLGMSAGGVLAVEMARLLLARGAQVGPVVMLDTAAPGSGGPVDEEQYETPGTRRQLPLRAQARATALRLLSAYDLRRRGRLRPQLRPARILRWTYRAFEAHRMAPVDAPVVLIRAADGDGPVDDRGWSRWAPTEVIPGYGHHGGMMRHPNMVPNATILRDVLAAYDARPQAEAVAVPPQAR